MKNAFKVSALGRPASFLLALAGLVAIAGLAASCNKGTKSGDAAGADSKPAFGLGDIARMAGVDNRYVTAGESGGKLVSTLGMEDDPQLQQALGESVTLSALNRTPLAANEALNKYVTLVGLSLIDSSSNPSAEFSFGVLDSPDVNAFSAPNGSVLITTGAIKLMQDESELAGVLAHEITHVIEKHGIKAVVAAKRTGALVDFGKAMANVPPAFGPFTGGADALADIVFVKGFDKETERLADRGAVTLCQSAGYDPSGLVRFLERLEAKNPGNDGGAFSTHPGKADRIKDLKKQIGAMGGAKMADRFASSTR